jgi:hypothetical protein
MSGIEGDQLIALVFETQAIWDRRAKQHSNRNYVEKCWKEISIEMKIDGKCSFFSNLYFYLFNA